MAKDKKHQKKTPPPRRTSKRTRSAAAPAEATVAKKQKPQKESFAAAKPPPKGSTKPPPKTAAKPPPKGSTRQKPRSLISISNRLPVQKDGINYHFPPVFFLPTSPESTSNIRIFPERNTNTQLFFRSNGPPPVLTKQQTALWRQKYAATACVNRAAFPFGVYRLLGTITRSGVALNLNKKIAAKNFPPMQYPYVNERRPKSISSGNAQKMAQIEFENGELNERKISSRANEIQNEWKEILAEDTYPGSCPWDNQGDFQFPDDGHIPLHVLLQSLSTSDESDLKDILEACKDLCDPRQLWKIPLLMVYPVVTSEAAETYSLRLAIYMHRLLAEASTISLRTVLEALDEDSYLCPRPCVEIPQEQVFASNPYPEVVTTEEDAMVLEEEGEEEGTTKDKVDESKISAFSTEGLLKLLENPGTDISEYEKRYAVRVNASIKLNLMDYQVHGVAWMLQMEELDSINDLLWEEREFWDGGKYYCCPELGEIRLDRPARLKGGLVCDTMGLGKTIEVLSLIVATLPEIKKEAEVSGGNHATLIIVPPALVAQWLNEIQKCVGDTFLAVDYFDFRSGRDGTLERRLGNPEDNVDIVVTTYNALDKPGSAKVLQSEMWGRIVLDEMQEIRSSTTMIAKMCEKLSGSRRWMLSGTPLFDGIGDLRGELNFLKLCPFAASNEDGFFKFMIGDPWENRDPEVIDRLELLSSIMLRRSKNMYVVKTGRSILDRLPPLTVEFLPVQQSDSERALYYFMEAVTGREATADKEVHRKQTRLCLRFLRELCVSPILLNGGAGVVPQLKNLNTLLISQGRRVIYAAASTSKRGNGASRSLNCDDAILHLAHLQEAARTGKGEVAEMAVGFGQGLAGRGRSRAIDSDKIEENKAKLAVARKDNNAAQRRRAKLRWHLALEMVTTGQCPVPRSKLSGLWLWRSALLNSKEAPHFLRRGWQSSQGFLSRLEFAWAKPNSLYLTEIPDGISRTTVEAAIKNCIPQHEPCEVVESKRSSSVWSAYLHFSSCEAMEIVVSEAKKTRGIILEDDENSPVLKLLIENAEEAYKNATTTSSLHPTDDNTEKRKAARRLLSRMKTHGLSILVAGGNGHPVLEKCQSISVPRENVPVGWGEAARLEVRQLNERIEETTEAVKKCEGWASRLGKTVESMSAVESLQALATGNEEKTSCCICLGALGSTNEDGANGQATISLTKCGHLYCRKCLFDYINQGFAHANCPTCRKSLSYGNDVVHVDPTLKEDETTGDQFRALVEEALGILNKEGGKLPSEMWDHLFKSVELPSLDTVSRLRDARFSAISGNVLAHLRFCVGNVLSPKRSDVPDDISSVLSSKVQALIRDIPRDERSVVFATSKNTIEHLAFVLPLVGIPCRSLCSGQPVDDTEQAISEWQSCSQDGSAVLVLLVQSGAAASGVTLTAACKMFMMEPFPRLSEEQQAYGRCHRIGQQHPVHARVYYTPISVESRLLEWRKRSKAGAEKNNALTEDTTKVVYASLDSDDESFEEDESGAEDEEELADFLIGDSKV